MFFLKNLRYAQGAEAALDIYGQRALRFNGSRTVRFPNVDFYNVGAGDFAFVVRVFMLSPAQNFQVLLGKFDLVNPGTNGLSLQVSGGQVRFNIEFNRTGGAGQMDIRSPANVIQAATWYTIIAQRNGYAKFLANPAYTNYNKTVADYEIWVNGVKQAIGNPSPLSAPGIDTTGPFTMSLESYNGPRFTDFGAYYVGRGLSTAEIASIQSAGESGLPPSNARGVFSFNQASGTTVLDRSSVRSNGTLFFYTAAEVDATTNSVWLPTDGIKAFAPNTTGVAPSNGHFVAPEPLTITRFVRVNGVQVAAWSLDGINFTTLTFDANEGATVNIALAAGQTLYLNGSVGANSGQYAALCLVF